MRLFGSFIPANPGRLLLFRGGLSDAEPWVIEGPGSCDVRVCDRRRSGDHEMRATLRVADWQRTRRGIAAWPSVLV
jgi:hypothetical protein